MKSYLLHKNADQLSSIEPQSYGRRFYNFMESKVFI